MDDDTIAIRRLLAAARRGAPDHPRPTAAGSAKVAMVAWAVALTALAAWLVYAWLARPIPVRPDDRPIGDIAFLLAFIVVPIVFVLSVIGGALARPMPRFAPVVTAGLVAVVVAAGATEAGFTSFNVLCGTPGYPSCATGVGSRVVAVGGAFVTMGMAMAITAVIARRYATDPLPLSDPPDAVEDVAESRPIVGDPGPGDPDAARESYLRADGEERAFVVWQVRNAVRLDH